MEAVQQGLTSMTDGVQQLEYKQRLYITVAAAALGGAYLRLFVSRLRPVWGTIAICPLLLMNCWLPLIFHIRNEVLTRASWMLLLLWLANFKVCTSCCVLYTRQQAMRC